MATRIALNRFSRSLTVTLGWLLCGAVGAGCDAADYSDVVTLDVQSGGEAAGTTGTYESLRVFALSEVGRASIDYELRAGPSGANLQLAAQMQTSGDSDSAACEALGAESVAQRTASSESVAAAATADNDLVTVDQAVDLQVPAAAPDEEIRYLRFRPAGSGIISINLFVSPATAEPRLTVDGDEVLPSLIRGTDPACVAQGGVVYRYEVEAAKLHLLGWSAATIRADKPRLVLQTACETDRSVPATCAGHVALPSTTQPLDLAPGEAATGHLSTAILGIGDRVVLALRCTPLEGESDCAASSRVVVRFEPVECKSSADCDPAQTCSSDGYCTGDTSCSAGGLPLRGWLLVAGTLLLIARRRRLGRAAALLLLVLLPSAAHAEVPRGTEVFAEAGAGGRLFVGEFYDLAGAGGALYERQGLQFGPWGGRVTLAVDYTLTDQPAPPFQPSLQTLGISFGLQRRFMVAGHDFEAGADITRLGILANPLVAYTGPATNFLGLGTELRWLLQNSAQQYLAVGTTASGFFDDSGFRPSLLLTVGAGFRTSP